MSERIWSDMNEAEFDTMLKDCIDDLPPENIIAGVTPWRKGLKRILWGMALNLITLNFLCLNYILPAVGTAIALMGFRTLCRENCWFRACWIITICRAVCLIPDLWLKATILPCQGRFESLTDTATLLNLFLSLLLIFCFWQGLRAAQSNAGLPVHARSGAALFVWYGILSLLALIGYGQMSIVGAVIMLASYIGILYSLIKLSKEMDEAGYTVQPVSVRVSDRWLGTAFFLLLTIGIAAGYLFFNSYTMDWKETERTKEQAVSETEAYLADLGFPKEILDDLTTEDIKACQEAKRVVVGTKDHPLNVNSQKNMLRFTEIAVELPGETSRWKVIHYFLWLEDPGFYGTEAIQIWPAYQNDEHWIPDEKITGQVLYDRDQKTYVSRYVSQKEERYETDSFFGDTEIRDSIFAEFSMTEKGSKYRGYISYVTESTTAEPSMINSWINYTHQRSWFQYPVVTAKEKSMRGDWEDTGAFVTIQNALRFYLENDEVKML